MKTNNSFDKKLNKRCSGVLISALLMCFCVILITFILAGCNKQNEESETVTTAASTEDESFVLDIDEEKYTFKDGIRIGNAAIGNKTFKEVREIANKELNSMIKDFTVTINIGKEKHDFNRDSFQFENNIEKVLVEAVKFNDKLAEAKEDKKTEEKTFDLTFEVNKDSVSKEVASLAKLFDIEPVDATISGASNGKVSITEAKDGKCINQDKLVKDIISAVNALSKGNEAKTEIDAELKSIKPKVSHEDLDSNITLLSSYTTVSTNTADGNHNMKLALDSCDGSIIMPGETWSFNACTGNSNLTSLGYRYATVIIGGELVPGIGGGLCQSSTTIYNAAIRTNMEIVERYCHYFQSTYAPAGLDATIDYPNLDLKLKNPTEYPMYMQCYMSGTTLYCNIYGYQDPSFDRVVIDSGVYDANYAENYFRAWASRTFYKGDKVVKEEDLPSSTYHYKSPSDETSTATTSKPAKPTKPTTTAPTTPQPSTSTSQPTIPTTQTNPPTPTVPTPSTTPPTPPQPTVPVSTQPIEY